MRFRVGLVLLGAATLLLAGCVWQPHPSPSDDVVGIGMQSLSGGPETPGPESTVRNGPLEKTVGEPFEVTSTDGAIARFIVTELTVDAPCSSASAREPSNGHFVRIEIEGSTGADLSRSLAFGEGAWSVVGAGGGAVDRGSWTTAAAACIPEAERLPTAVTADEVVAGAVVLDVTTEHGTVILEVARGLSWTWSY